MSCCDLDLWPVDLERSWYIKRHVIKVCAKFERNQTIPGWIIDIFANFCTRWPWPMTSWPWTFHFGCHAFKLKQNLLLATCTACKCVGNLSPLSRRRRRRRIFLRLVAAAGKIRLSRFSRLAAKSLFSRPMTRKKSHRNIDYTDQTFSGKALRELTPSVLANMRSRLLYVVVRPSVVCL